MREIWRISSAKRWTVEHFMVFRNNRSGWHVVKHPLSLTSIEEKNRGGSRNPVTTKIEFYVAMLFDLLLKGTKEFNRHTCHSKKLRGIQFLEPNWLSKNIVGTASIVSFFWLLYINFILHPYFTWSSWIPMRWKSSSFSSSFLHGRWRLTTEIPIFASLYHLFCSFKNPQKQPCVCVLPKRCYSKFCKIHRKTHVPESIFNKVKLATLLKKDSGTRIFQWIFRNY